jgi:hypothetical protein
MTLSLRAALCVAALIVLASGQTPPRCDGTPNVIPPFVFEESASVLVNRSANGLKFIAAPSADFEAPLTVLHVYGSQYEMGFAYGSLMSNEIRTLIPEIIAYVEATINASSLPPVVKEWVECCGVKWALEMTYNATKPYTPAWHEDTLRGMAAGGECGPAIAVRAALRPYLYTPFSAPPYAYSSPQPACLSTLWPASP